MGISNVMLVFRGVNTWSITPLIRGEQKNQLVSHVFQAIYRGAITPFRRKVGVHFVGGGLKGTCLGGFFLSRKKEADITWRIIPGWNVSG